MSKKGSKASVTSNYLTAKTKRLSEQSAPFGSRLAFGQTFAVCAFPVQAWAFVNLFREIPALVIRLAAWDILGVAGYVLAFALLESLCVWLIVLMAALVLPMSWFRNRFVAQSAWMVMVSAAWAVLGQRYLEAVLDWGVIHWVMWGLLYIATLILAAWSLRRWRTVERLTLALVERLVTLSTLYLVFGGLGLILVVIRNLVGR